MSVSGGNTVRGWMNAMLLSAIDAAMHRIYGTRKRELFADLPATVVELGPGVGANLSYYKPGMKLVAFEPGSAVHGGLTRRAARCGIDLELRGIAAEALDCETASVDVVISTLVLCSVRDPSHVLCQVRRVLRPEGRFLFIEHVAAPAGSALRAVQNLVHGPWHWCFEGCNTNRDTAATLERAGFASLEIERFRVGSPLVPVAPHIAGVAVR